LVRMRSVGMGGADLAVVGVGPVILSPGAGTAKRDRELLAVAYGNPVGFVT
jgi:hypothetical protein